MGERVRNRSILNGINPLAFLLKYARVRYIIYRIFLRIKIGKAKRNEYLQGTGLSPIDFLPELPYSKDGVKVIPRKGTYDYYMFFVSREEEIQEHLKMNKNEIFLDIGANIGSYSLRIAKKYKKMGIRVIAIEAHPYNYEALCNNIKLNKLDNIVTVNKAVSAHKGMAKLYERVHTGTKRIGSDLYSLCNDSLSPSNVIKEDGKIIDVECDTIDNILSNMRFNRIDIMKMDIEGAEILALDGASNALQQVRKAIVEVHGDNLQSVKNILQSYGFEIIVTNAEMKHVIGTKHHSQMPK